jgi:chemotaxis protein methyltransferase CheR
VIHRHLGLQLNEVPSQVLEDALLRRTSSRGYRRADLYLDDVDAEEVRWIAEAVTVTETYFLRERAQLQALADMVIPSLAHRRKIRILSAGCASGEEPYSIALVLREILPDIDRWEITLRAFDVNRAMLRQAARGRYGAWALRETPPAIVERYFRRTDGHFELAQSVRSMVAFEEQNLVHDNPGLWAPGSWDAVFCRNVLMYLAPEVASAAIDRMAMALDRKGFLFIGHAETLRGVSEAFEVCHSAGAFYYRLRGGEARLAADRAAPPAAVSPPPPAAALPPPLPPRPISVPRPELSHVTELMRQERYREALETVRAVDASSPGARVLEALLCAHAGDVQRAAALCGAILDADPLHAGAHYVRALTAEQSGDRAQAADLHRTAAFLDPSFAMPRLQLGLLARRSGDEASARRELGRALVLLEQEDPSRLALFGGGFGRTALMALCRAALSELGGDR